LFYRHLSSSVRNSKATVLFSFWKSDRGVDTRLRDNLQIGDKAIAKYAEPDFGHDSKLQFVSYERQGNEYGDHGQCDNLGGLQAHVSCASFGFHGGWDDWTV